jgi:hypothetical protein
MKLNQVVNYALGLVGLGVVVYVAGRAWKASKTSTLGDKAVGAVEGLADEVKGAVSTGNVTTGETGACCKCRQLPLRRKAILQAVAVE